MLPYQPTAQASLGVVNWTPVKLFSVPLSSNRQFLPPSSVNVMNPISATATPLCLSIKWMLLIVSRTCPLIRGIRLSCRFHVAPLFFVWKIEPSLPTSHPSPWLMKKTCLLSLIIRSLSPSIRLLCSCHVFPPSLVCRILSCSPTIQPRLLSTNHTPLSGNSLTNSRRFHVFPPFCV